MKTIDVSNLQINQPELINVDFLKDYIPENTSLEIFGISKNFKGHGHFKITIDCRINGEYVFLSHVTTDTMSIDGFWSDINTQEDIEIEADCAESLIWGVLKDNECYFDLEK